MTSEKPIPLAPGQLYRFAWSFYLLLALAGVLWIGVARRVIPLALFVDRERWWLDLALGVGGGLLLLALWAAASRLLPAARDLEARLAQILGPLPPGDAVVLALLSSFAEELFFRGALQGALGPITATLLFGLLHSGPGRAFRLWTVFACLAGALFGTLMQWRGNLLAPVVGHFVINAVNLYRLGRRADMFGRLPPGSEQNQKET